MPHIHTESDVGSAESAVTKSQYGFEFSQVSHQIVCMHKRDNVGNEKKIEIFYTIHGITKVCRKVYSFTIC